jgi:hypothetical protein
VCVNNGISAGAGWPCFFHERNDIWYGPDAFLEHWPAGWAAMENTMLYQEKSVFDLGVPTPLLSCGPAITVVATKMCHVGAGPIGYFGANGLYVTGSPLCHPPGPSALIQSLLTPGAQKPQNFKAALEFWKANHS